MVRSLGTLALTATFSAFAFGGAFAQTPPHDPTQSTGQSGAQQSVTEQGQKDEAAARQALLQARESLAELAKSPEAAQLQGQPRTEVSELITNFNALLSAESGWYEQYKLVMQNLYNVLGPASADETATGTTGSTTSGSASGTSGTTGSTAGTSDPASSGEVPAALRSKLVDFRQKLTEFGRAAGAPDVTGGVSSSSSSAGTGSQAPATPGTSSETPSGTSGTSGMTPAESETLEKHLDAIDDIIQQAISGGASTGSATPGSTTSGSTGTSGSTSGTSGATSGTSASPGAGVVTIDRSKLDSIQSHLQRIREIARSKGIR
jgi:hypothetical protein